MSAFVRRWRWPLALVVLVVAVLPVKWFNDSVLAYDGLVAAGGGWNGAPYGPDDVKLRTVEQPFGETQAEFPFKPNGTVSWAFSLLNSGDRPVRVTGLPFGGSVNFDVQAVQIGDGGENERNGGSPTGFVPFRPFTMKPGAIRYVRFVVRLMPCAADGSGGGNSWQQQEVEYEVAGVGRKTVIEFVDPIAITGIPAPCDERQRQTNARSAAGRARFVADDAVGISTRPDD